jgi:hypothetical protein
MKGHKDYSKISGKVIESQIGLTKHLLEKQGAFYPYGVEVTNEKIAMVSGYTGSEHPQSQDLIVLLKKGMRDHLEDKSINLGVIISDNRVTNPNMNNKIMDAVVFTFDDGLTPSCVAYPYTLKKILFKRKLVFFDAFGTAAKSF